MNEPRRRLWHLPLLTAMLGATLVLGACSEKHRSPTEPDLALDRSAAQVSSASDAARGGRKPKPGDGDGVELSLEIQPNVWNTNWKNSAGTVSAVIRGKGLDKVDLSSIVLIGTDGGGTPLPALRAQKNGNHIRAFFAKGDALETLETPARGEAHEVKVELSADGETQSLSARVRIVGPAGGGGDDDGEVDLRVEIQPDTWNMNWRRSAGTVSAVIRGGDLAGLDLGSIELVGTDEDAAPLPALRAQRNGNHVRAFFDKSDAFATLDTPRPGETHKIIIRVTVEGDGSAADEEGELSDTIRVVGPSR